MKYAYQAHALLPHDAKFVSSYGKPTEGGYREYHQTQLGQLWLIYNGPYDLPHNELKWECRRIID